MNGKSPPSFLPSIGTRARLGLRPKVPVQCAGPRIEPPLSLELATGTTPAATAADDPPLEPPRTRSEEHTSELQSLMRISYAVFCLKKKTQTRKPKKKSAMTNDNVTITSAEEY